MRLLPLISQVMLRGCISCLKSLLPAAFVCAAFPSSAQKVLICHNGNTICVSVSAVPAHLTHGDNLGDCGSAKTGTSHQTFMEEPPAPLLDIFPNPFSLTTTIRFTMPAGQPVKLDIYSIAGVHVETLFNANAAAEKTYTFTFGNEMLAGGVYLCRMISEDSSEYRKIVLVK